MMNNHQSLNVRLTLFQVQNLNGSPISVFNTVQEHQQPTSTNFENLFADTYTNLETSVELQPFDFNSNFAELFSTTLNNDSELSAENYIDIDTWLGESNPLETADTIDKLLTMTFNDITNNQNDQQQCPSEELPHTSTTSSSSTSLLASTTNTNRRSTVESSVDDSMDSSSFNDEDSPGEQKDGIKRETSKSGGASVKKLARFGNKQVVKYSNEYHDRRVKNNEAVKKSRMKAKEKQKDTEGKLSKLAEENRKLNDRVDLLLKELHVLKSLYKELNQEVPPEALKSLERVNVR
ncbi:unnamed protein product [Didymodactylos carnosus]|nr:unnamed protein product [Didymodactylos carnosus]CAF3846923.1 unnamed protein product [Didymodactylos carnosus]